MTDSALAARPLGVRLKTEIQAFLFRVAESFGTQRPESMTALHRMLFGCRDLTSEGLEAVLVEYVNATVYPTICTGCQSDFLAQGHYAVAKTGDGLLVFECTRCDFRTPRPIKALELVSLTLYIGDSLGLRGACNDTLLLIRDAYRMRVQLLAGFFPFLSSVYAPPFSPHYHAGEFLSELQAGRICHSCAGPLNDSGCPSGCSASSVGNTETIFERVSEYSLAQPQHQDPVDILVRLFSAGLGWPPPDEVAPPPPPPSYLGAIAQCFLGARPPPPT